MAHTDKDQLRRLFEGSRDGERPGALGLMGLSVLCRAGESLEVLTAAQAGFALHLRGEQSESDFELDFDADWGLWSLSAVGDDALRLELVVYGFPVSGLSQLRSFLIRCGAIEVRSIPSTEPR